MSSIQRISLGLLGLCAAGSVGYLLLGPGGGTHGDGTDALQLEQAWAGERNSIADEAAPLSLVSDRQSVLASGVAVVNVRALNGLGRRVGRAKIRLSNAEGMIEYTADETARFENVSPGAWTLEVTARSLLTHTQTIEVVEGEHQRYTVKLRKHLPITGTVRNRFGDPPGIMPIWFLRPGESHPMERTGARKLLESQVMGGGDFAIDLPKAGEYRISVGPIGKPLGTMSKSRVLHAGGTQEVEIVVSGGTRLEIQLEDPPPTLAEGKAFFRVAIVGQSYRAGNKGAPRRLQAAKAGSRQAGSRRGKRSAKSDGESAAGKGSGRRRARGPSKVEGPVPSGSKQRTADQDPSGATAASKRNGRFPGDGREEGAWMDRVTRSVPRDGKLRFEGLPAGEELKLAFLRRNDRHLSINTIILPEDRQVVVSFRVPDRIPKERAGEVQELSVMIDTLPLPANAPKAGFHWK